MSTSCHKVPPVKSNYVPLGTIEKFNDLDVYVSKPTNGSNSFKKAVVVGYDIFGYHPNVKQFCDLLANAGYLVVLPDYFRGKTATIMSQGVQALLDFIIKTFTPEIIIKDTLSVTNHLKSKFGSKDFGYIGFCWGGMMGSKLCAIKEFNACVLVHYGPLQVDDFKKSQCPIAFLPTFEDQDSQPFVDAMKDKPFANKNFQKRFVDMNHGFAASRGDWSDPLISQRVNEVIEITGKFFRDNVGCN
ncbi:dienelactone hydrolase family-domain-containing protein [Rhizophagus diaphanus]|nr:dienelactone hydrolase family-domain-containing protein [Rhizophagus diaphanus] [Rhizophagus sp. MUCL 43196]